MEHHLEARKEKKKKNDWIYMPEIVIVLMESYSFIRQCMQFCFLNIYYVRDHTPGTEKRKNGKAS